MFFINRNAGANTTETVLLILVGLIAVAVPFYGLMTSFGNRMNTIKNRM